MGAIVQKIIFAPRWLDLGQLAATIAIRTALNYLLLQAIAQLLAKATSETLVSAIDSG